MSLEKQFESLRASSVKLAVMNAAEKNKVLNHVADVIDARRKEIISANEIDVANARKAGISESVIDRLMLNDKRIDGIIESMRLVISQTDPVGEQVAGWKHPNGMSIRSVRVPLGVVAIIYENRPNVTFDVFSLAYKSGNSVLLRGSSNSFISNKKIVEVIKDALKECGGDPDALELVQVKEHDHSDVDEIMNAVGKIDVLLPRGGKKLIENVVRNSKVPVIETGSGVCHLYIDESADLEMAATIAENGKIQRPSVCNALECIVVNEKCSDKFLPMLADKFAGRVKMHADEKSFAVLSGIKSAEGFVVKATDEDFGNEFLDYECAVKTVSDVDQAIEFINSHNTKHSESIITQSRRNAAKFQQMIDASCVYVNASTRFTDGGEFGFGAELGISTQKLHVRGPMGIKVLTTTKYLIDGDGQIR